MELQLELFSNYPRLAPPVIVEHLAYLDLQNQLEEMKRLLEMKVNENAN